MSLFGGLAAAGLGGTAIAQSASPKPDTAPATGDIDAAAKAGLDRADAEFSQYRPYRRPYRRQPPPRVVHRRRRRRVVRNGRVYYVY